MGVLLLLNNLLYDSFVVLASPWLSREWVPMAKQSSDEPQFRTCFMMTLPSTIAGVALLLIGCNVSRSWTLVTSPVIASFLLCSVTVFWTAKRVCREC